MTVLQGAVIFTVGFIIGALSWLKVKARQLPASGIRRLITYLSNELEKRNEIQ